MGVSNEIDNTTIAIDETMIFEIKTMMTLEIFQKSSLINIKILFGKSSCGN